LSAGSDGAPSTIFDSILDGSIPSTKVYDNEWVYAFRDISPVAKTHVLIIPKIRDGLVGLSNASETEKDRFIVQLTQSVLHNKFSLFFY